MSRKAIGGLLAVGVLAVAAGTWALMDWLAPAQSGQRTGEAAIESDFVLVDEGGKEATDEDFQGQWQLVFFGFTHCPDICPTTLDTVARVMEDLGDDAKQVQPLFITVDPERDTPEVMAEYTSLFHPRIVGLTGTPEQVKDAAGAFRAYYAKVQREGAPDGYSMDHSAFIYLMDPKGDYATHFSHQDEVDSIVEGVRATMQGEQQV